jgi:hypothetical protein
MNPEGETIETMERQYNQHELEDKLKQWLRDTIARLEGERAQHAEGAKPAAR